ncbi:MAG: PAS domain S-box protein [Ignavibacteriales bacterium]|nr:PAS domain S-box protein [Ignavibacteriales bacterium]
MPTPPVDLLWPTIIAITAVFTIGAVFVVSIYFGQRRYIRSQETVLARLQEEVAERTRAEQQYRDIFENAVEGIFQVATNGDLITANPALARIFGYVSPELLMRDIKSEVRQSLLPEFRQKRFLTILEEQGTVANYISTALREDKKRIWVSTNIRAVRDSKQATLYFEGTIEDITERRQAERLQRELSRRILEAQESERKRVAFELHDSVNQMLSSVRYRLKSAEETSRGKIRNGWDGAQESRVLVEKTIQEIRRISRNLRPSALDDLGLAAAVRTLSDEFVKRTGIPLQVDSSKLTRRLPPNVELALFRVVQEALNNIEKHSQAKSVNIRLALGNSAALAVIIDDGKGFNPVTLNRQKQRGLGLISMKERASLLGGSMTIDSASGKGTKVEARIPLIVRK